MFSFEIMVGLFFICSMWKNLQLGYLGAWCPSQASRQLFRSIQFFRWYQAQSAPCIVTFPSQLQFSCVDNLHVRFVPLLDFITRTTYCCRSIFLHSLLFCGNRYVVMEHIHHVLYTDIYLERHNTSIIIVANIADLCELIDFEIAGSINCKALFFIFPYFIFLRQRYSSLITFQTIHTKPPNMQNIKCWNPAPWPTHQKSEPVLNPKPAPRNTL